MDIYLDMDGVLVDFLRRLCAWFNKENPYSQPRSQGVWDCYKLLGLGPVDIASALNTSRFWREMEWMPDGKDIFTAVARAVGKQNICILTHTSNFPEAAGGKAWWLSEHLPGVPARILFGDDAPEAKASKAASDTILVDDSDANVHAYRDECCPAILVPRPWNSRHVDAGRALELVTRELNELLLLTEVT